MGVVFNQNIFSSFLWGKNQSVTESMTSAASGRVMAAWNTPPITPPTPGLSESHTMLRPYAQSGQGQHTDPVIRGSNSSRQGK